MLLTEVEGVRYELFNMSDIHETARVAGDAFARHEPLARSLAIASEDFAEFVRLLGPKAHEEELSVITRDNKSGRVIGAMMTDDFAVEPPETLKQLGEKFEPVWAVLAELDTRYKQGKDLSAGEYLHLFLLAVDRQHTGKRVAQNLVKTCLENGIAKGYTTGVVEASGVVSQHIFRQFGFLDRVETPYKTFTFQGKRVFESIEGHQGIVLMDNRLDREPGPR